MSTRAVVAAVIAAACLTPATAAAQDVYTQVACAPARENVSQNFANTSGGGTRIDGPIGGRGWQCRSYKTTHAPYMRLASRRIGVPLKCEIWKRGLRLVWDEQPTAVGCYVLMPRSR